MLKSISIYGSAPVKKMLEELDRAGFPDVSRDWTGPNEKGEETTEHFLIRSELPSIRELLGILGSEFGFLAHRPRNAASFDPENEEYAPWDACAANGEIDGLGETPEEALCNLWLNLKKDKAVRELLEQGRK